MTLAVENKRRLLEIVSALGLAPTLLIGWKCPGRAPGGSRADRYNYNAFTDEARVSSGENRVFENTEVRQGRSGELCS